MDTDSFIVHIKIEDFYEDIANDVEKMVWHKGKNKKVIGLFKDELRRKIMIEFVGLRA